MLYYVGMLVIPCASVQETLPTWRSICKHPEVTVPVLGDSIYNSLLHTIYVDSSDTAPLRQAALRLVRYPP